VIEVQTVLEAYLNEIAGPDLIRWAIERCDEPKVLCARPGMLISHLG
jgi:hypothetical protein